MAKRYRLVPLLVSVLIGLSPIAQAEDFKVIVNASNSID